MMKQKKVRRKKIRLGSISGDLAEKIARALDDSSVMYIQVNPRLLDVYQVD